MEQVKLFKGVEMELRALEDEINEWLREAKPRVISITGNIAPQSSSGGSFTTSDILLIVTYETSG